MKQATDHPVPSPSAGDAARLRRLFADTFGPEVLSTLSLRLQAVSSRQAQHRDAIAWTRLALCCDARPS